ncbi:hypothetical protein MLD38_034181 [Melastoma candidum]|uniref:Uncharacterized protein n=1 Tax=Melastoma candidum TaxID=119954 RepID=A0ACB9MBG3_9MYRT|nr:hypothetical protein MLD38_034181 [Melastoma candidum]
MGVEVDGFEMAPPPAAALAEPSKVGSSEKVNGKLDPVANGGADMSQEASKISEASYPQDVMNEWPAPSKIHDFYFVRFRALEDPQIKMKLEKADKEIQQKNQTRFQITDKLRAKREVLLLISQSERSEIISQLKALGVENKQFNMAMDEKRKKMEPLQQALGKLRNTNTGNRGGGGGGGGGSGLCSSEEELNDVIHSLHYRIQHESISLAEEKQIIREIKQLEGTRDKVIANAAMRAEIQGSMGQKEDIQDQVKLIGVDLDEVRKDQQAVKAKIKQLRDELDGIDAQIKSLQDELEVVVESRDKAYSNMQDLRLQRDEGNAPFYQNRSLFNCVRDLAAKKDVMALVDLSHTEVDKFFSLWNGSKSFRDDYQKRILTSLDGRQMSKDGRTRLPHEKPLVAVERFPSAPEKAAEAKMPKEAVKPPVHEDPVPPQKVEKESTKKASDSVKKSKAKELETKESKSEEDAYVIPKHEPPPVVQIDEKTLREMKREEQIAKQKQALERKKKLAEKNAAKAAIKAQKEAEKKLKEIREREKKLKKKGGAAETEEEAETAADAAEPEKPEETLEVPIQVAAKERKEKTVRVRKQGKAPESMPKAILKRKKSDSYWVWAAGSAAVAVFLCLIIAFYSHR